MTETQRREVHAVLMRNVRATDDTREWCATLAWDDVNALEDLFNRWAVAELRNLPGRKTCEEILKLERE